MHHVGEELVDREPGRSPSPAISESTESILAVAGAECPNCANRIRNALLGVKGVLEAHVDPGRALVQVRHQRSDGGFERELMIAVQEASRGTHYRYLAVPVRARFAER